MCHRTFNGIGKIIIIIIIIIINKNKDGICIANNKEKISEISEYFSQNISKR